MQKTDVEQAMKNKLNDTQQKLSEKEQEIEKMKQEVSPVFGVLRVCYTLECRRQR